MLKIAAVSQPGIVAELSDRLAVLTGDPKAVETAAIVVPLRPGSRTEVEALLRNGPPFDPSRLGLVRHEVFVSEDEAIFVFHGLPSVFVAAAGRGRFVLERVTACGGRWCADGLGSPRLPTAGADPRQRRR